jgi:hypothetical protein
MSDCREFGRETGAMEDALGQAIVKLWRAFWARRFHRWRAILRALGRWIHLAGKRRKDDAVVAEMASVQNFLQPTPLAPLRMIGAVTMLISLGSMVFAYWQSVRVNAVEQKLEKALSAAAEAKAELARVAEANESLRQAAAAAEADSIRARGELFLQAKALRQAQAAAAERLATVERIRRVADQLKARLKDGAKTVAGMGDRPFDGDEWLRERREAESDLRGTSPPEPAATPR